jgi:acetyltransferase-like isoleucine patch superfamily enzyme
MKTPVFARENGWLLLLQREAGDGLRRLRDSAVASKLGTTEFRCGRAASLHGLAHIRMGRRFTAGDSFWLHAVTEHAGENYSPLLTIDDDVSVSNSVHIACTHNISIGSGTLIGSRVIITDHAHGTYRGDNQSSPDTLPNRRHLSSVGPVVIGRDVWIGDGVAVLAGAQIGDGCVIGANSVVSGIIPSGTMAVGAPAKPVRRWDAVSRQWVPVSDQ